jgi:hypothetical protein
MYFNALLYLLVLLECPDTVLIERVMGKRIDPDTKGNYITVHGTVNKQIRIGVAAGTQISLS